MSGPVCLQVRFIVMNNLMQTDLEIHRKYDLKGSTQGRFSGVAPNPSAILKDLDVDMALKLEDSWPERYFLYMLASLPGLVTLGR